MQYEIGKIADIVGASVHGCTNYSVNWLLTDSRSLCFPEETLFFALKTSRGDGMDYILELYRRGVRCFVVNRLPDGSADMAEGCFLVVNDTLAALQTLAAYHRSLMDIPVIAITGSNGKTTVKEWLYQLLSPFMNVCRSPRSYNSQVGVPLSVWLIDKHHDVAIIEAGISKPGEMLRLEQIVRPEIGVLTNIGEAHQENFLSYEIKCAEKLSLFRRSEVVVANFDDEVIAKSASLLDPKTLLMNWRTGTDTNTPLMVKEVVKTSESSTIRYVYQGEEGEYRIPFIDHASIANSVTCFAACLAFFDLWTPKNDEKSLPWRQDRERFVSLLKLRMEVLEPVAMRMEVKAGSNGCTLINDTYNSDIHSLDIALDFMGRRPETKTQKRTLILSDILQSGESSRSLYSRVAALCANRGIQKVIGVGNELASCGDYFPMEKHFFRSTSELMADECFRQLHDEFILIKGARSFRFDRICDALTQKVHQTIMEVNLNALVDNLNYYRSFMDKSTKMVCMVKASAYGVGAIEVSKTLQDHQVDYLAVAVADEGAELRRAGITANIMVMNPEMTSFKTLFEYRLEPEVYCFSLLEALIKAAEKEGITNFPVHLKLDTGMHRLGFDPKHDVDELIQRLLRQTALVPCSVFSHFVGSDDDGFDDFSIGQFALFDEASKKIQQVYSHRILRHICNSAGIEHFPQYHLDMVRLGLGLYGVNPRNNEALHTVATLKTTILQLRRVPAGDSIGYSRKTFVERDSMVAAIPIGYADGLNRRLGNRHCHCLVNGHEAPYLGNICMDVCMIDVTGIDCHEGDEAVIFSDQLPVTVLSDAIGTIPYEILTGISERVQRIYVQE